MSLSPRTTLLVSLFGSGLLLAAAGPMVGELLRSESVTRAIVAERESVYLRLLETEDEGVGPEMNRFIEDDYLRWLSLEGEPAADELRVFLIGNSAALFCVSPRLVEVSLAEQLPERRVSVSSLIFAGMRAADEPLLVRAALERSAHVIVLMPNTFSVFPGPSRYSPRIRELYGHIGEEVSDPLVWLRSRMRAAWAPYRSRERLRSLALDALATQRRWPQPDAQAVLRAEKILAAVTHAAASGSVELLDRAYQEYGLPLRMQWTIVPPDSRSTVFDSIRSTGDMLRDHDVVALSLFHPINPIFRSENPVPGLEKFHVDPALIRSIESMASEAYRAASWIALDRTDALGPSAFFDYMHCNGNGMREYSRQVAKTITEYGG